jgi:hypothetical protein
VATAETGGHQPTEGRPQLEVAGPTQLGLLSPHCPRKHSEQKHLVLLELPAVHKATLWVHLLLQAAAPVTSKQPLKPIPLAKLVCKPFSCDMHVTLPRKTAQHIASFMSMTSYSEIKEEEM